jgi:nucleotidyltransferase substrate binding protein (TIGR01987 family)
MKSSGRINNMLELSSLEKAINSFARAVKVCTEKIADENVPQDELETIKAGVIQNFEFTYELCWKFMKRWIEQNISLSAADGVTRRELFRMSAENFLIDDVDEWMEFHQARNLTSHIYDADVAENVLDASLRFLPIAKHLKDSLEKRND